MGSSTYYGESDLSIEKLPKQKGKKLYEYAVINTKKFQRIGIIHWRGGWIQYVFMAHPEVDMSRSCMKEIIEFIDKLMKEWNNARRKK